MCVHKVRDPDGQGMRGDYTRRLVDRCVGEAEDSVHMRVSYRPLHSMPEYPSKIHIWLKVEERGERQSLSWRPFQR